MSADDVTPAGRLIALFRGQFSFAHGRRHPLHTAPFAKASEVAKNLGLSSGQMADDDLKQILSGLFSIAAGVGAARLAVHAARQVGKPVPKQRDQLQAYGASAKNGSPVKYSAGPHLQGPAVFGERAHSQVFGSSWNVCQLHKV
jgi:hypothetical protein